MPPGHVVPPPGGHARPPASQPPRPPAPPERRPHYPRRDYFEGNGLDGLLPDYYAEPDNQADYDDSYTEFDDYADDADEREPELLGAALDREQQTPSRRRRRGKSGKRFLGFMAALTVLVILAGAAWIGARELLGMNYEDYPGPGKDDVVIEVADGDSTTVIAESLAEADVVASTKAFLEASKDNPEIRGVRPGYYQLKTQMSGADAVTALVAPEARVGELQIRAGSQLDDIRLPDGKTANGVLTKLSLASCAKLNGKSTCVPVEQLRKVAASANLKKLGVAEWLVPAATKAAPERRLEGLIMPGVYDVKPGWDAETLLREVLSTSALRMEATGLPSGAKATGRQPYEVLIIASIIEREAVNHDFGRVSQVIYNRLDKNMRLEMDSTVNYVLDRPEVRTKASDRARAGDYNTYRNTGLPPTPISSPGPEALQAAQSPEKGPWLFFVKCEKNGLSCFAKTLDEHQRNISDAQARGAY